MEPSFKAQDMWGYFQSTTQAKNICVRNLARTQKAEKKKDLAPFVQGPRDMVSLVSFLFTLLIVVGHAWTMGPDVGRCLGSKFWDHGIPVALTESGLQEVPFSADVALLSPSRSLPLLIQALVLEQALVCEPKMPNAALTPWFQRRASFDTIPASEVFHKTKTGGAYDAELEHGIYLETLLTCSPSGNPLGPLLQSHPESRHCLKE